MTVVGPAHRSPSAPASGLGTIGRSVADVSGVLVTHNHSDHYGMVGSIRDESGKWSAMHHADAAQLELRYGPRSRCTAELLRSCGVPGEQLAELSTATMHGPKIEVLTPDRVLAGGEELCLGGPRLQAIHTPGHSPGRSPGHLVFATLGESHAHLQQLVRLGDVEYDDRTPVRWHPAAARAEGAGEGRAPGQGVAEREVGG